MKHNSTPHRVLLITLSLCDAVQTGRIHELSSLLDERQSALQEMALDRSLTHDEVKQIQQAEQRLERLLEAERIRAIAALSEAHRIRTGTRAYLRA